MTGAVILMVVAAIVIARVRRSRRRSHRFAVVRRDNATHLREIRTGLMIQNGAVLAAAEGAPPARPSTTETRREHALEVKTAETEHEVLMGYSSQQYLTEQWHRSEWCPVCREYVRQLGVRASRADRAFPWSVTNHDLLRMGREAFDVLELAEIAVGPGTLTGDEIVEAQRRLPIDCRAVVRRIWDGAAETICGCDGTKRDVAWLIDPDTSMPTAQKVCRRCGGGVLTSALPT